MIGIKSIQSFTPGTPIAVHESNEFKNLNAVEREYFETVGIDTVYDSGNLQSYDLAKGASEQLLEQNGLEGKDLDFIIYIQSRTPEHFISSEATRLQHDLGANSAMAFAISNLGCADSSMAIKLAMDLLKANKKAKNVLICYGNKLYSNYRFRYPVTVMGDGGIAALIGRTENNQILDIQMQSNGAYWDLFKMEYRGKKDEEFKETCSNLRKYGFELAIESKNRFQELNQKVLDHNGLTSSEIDHYMLQNISSRAYEYYEQAFDIKLSPICQMNLSKYGHLGSGDVFLNFKTGVDSGLFQEGQNVLIMNNSPAAAWSTVLLEI
ncbi:3-oxoacyl-[acyl-carrier-protein] synthase III C-terminal domain-containing protein [Luteibaculum oceani]|uniref:3-oxoacyl-ACP synthase n=1 Tax=Luteibaculum oceani TaxID=1294296 RepID=A0A5C6V9W5_9FLAO|nr:3-oxoacyl-[acyl-carrier-protein] synthase III C-terminal domain-containing protein [Luteibaculum oceani]TXC81939.1 3-oxoacyl-ACP synthase [Luteibaculum oceani]